MNLNQLIWSIAIPAIALFQGGTGFEQTISQAMTQAETQQRKLMLYFTSKPCEKCKTLDTYFSQKEVQRALSEHYVIVLVDIEDFDGRACREIYEVEEVPALVVIDPEGKIVYKAQGNVTKADVEPIVATGILPEYTDKGPIAVVPVRNTHPTLDQDGNIYAIQVGYFSSSENANRLKDEVVAEGYRQTQVREEQKQDKTFYRVLVGDYEGEEIAQTDLRKLKQSGFSVKVHKYRP